MLKNKSTIIYSELFLEVLCKTVNALQICSCEVNDKIIKLFYFLSTILPLFLQLIPYIKGKIVPFDASQQVFFLPKDFMNSINDHRIHCATRGAFLLHIILTSARVFCLRALCFTLFGNLTFSSFRPHIGHHCRRVLLLSLVPPHKVFLLYFYFTNFKPFCNCYTYLYTCL